MNELDSSLTVQASRSRRTIRAAVVLGSAAFVFFVVRFLHGLNSAFGGFAGTVDHWPFIYVCIPALLAVAFITRRIGRWHGLVSTVLFTGFVAWVCWIAAADIAGAYQTGWQDYGAQRWLLVQRWALIWGLAFAALFCILPTSLFRRDANPDATGNA